MATNALHLIIHGHVQGVGYRSWAVGNAREHNLTGWVRNNDDSTVEMVICGEAADVARMHQECKRGPLAARVLRIEATPWNGEVPEDFKQVRA